jgi:hypothetical protein
MPAVAQGTVRDCPAGSVYGVRSGPRHPIRPDVNPRNVARRPRMTGICWPSGGTARSRLPDAGGRSRRPRPGTGGEAARARRVWTTPGLGEPRSERTSAAGTPGASGSRSPQTGLAGGPPSGSSASTTIRTAPAWDIIAAALRRAAARRRKDMPAGPPAVPRPAPAPAARRHGLVVVQDSVGLLWQPSLEVVALECDGDVEPAAPA